MLCHEQQRSITCKIRVDQTISQQEDLGVAFIATGPGLGLVMYILTTLEFPKHNHDFHLDQTMSDLSPAWMRWEFICYHDSIFYSEQHNLIQFSFKGQLALFDLIIWAMPVARQNNCFHKILLQPFLPRGVTHACNLTRSFFPDANNYTLFCEKNYQS